MKVGVAYATPARQAWLTFEVPEGCTVLQAIERSGILKTFPDIDLAVQKIGIFGKLVTLETTLEDGARIEIYRPITVDPATVRRRRPTDGSGDGD